MINVIVPDVHFSSGSPPDRLDIALDLLIEFLLESSGVEQHVFENDRGVQIVIDTKASYNSEMSDLEGHQTRIKLLQVIHFHLAS